MTKSILLLALSSLLFVPSFASSPKVISMPIRHARNNRTHDLDKRDDDPFAASLQNLLAGHQYFATAQVGSPSQNIELVIDTGSSDTWMFGEGACKASQSGPCIGGEFNSANSNSYESLVNKLGQYHNRYGDGSTVRGPYFSDKFTIGGQTVQNLIMGLASVSHGIIRSGIMGIGYDTNEGRVAEGQRPYPNLPDELVKQDLIASKAYSLYLDDIASGTGSVLFGGYDPAKYYGDISMFPIQNDPLSGRKDAFYVSLTDIGLTTKNETDTVASSHDPYPIPVLLDSGTENINLPFELFEPFIRVFALKPLASGVEAYFAPFQVNCDITKKTPAGTAIVFAFGSSEGGTTISVPIEELVVPFYNPKNGKQLHVQGKPFCRFGMSAAPPGNPIILGQTFLRSAYVLYDLDNNAVGLAQAKFDKDSSSVQEYNASGSNKGVVTDSQEPTAKTVNYQAQSYFEGLTAATPVVSTIRTGYTVPYPKTTPPGSVAATPSPAVGKVSDNGGGGDLSPAGGKNDGSRISSFGLTGSLTLTASLLVSLVGTVYLL